MSETKQTHETTNDDRVWRRQLIGMAMQGLIVQTPWHVTPAMEDRAETAVRWADAIIAAEKRNDDR